MNAKRLPSGSYRARATATIDGERVFKSFTAETKEEAEFLAATWATKKKRSNKNPTLSEAIDAYISHREPILSPSTIAGYISLGEIIKSDLGRLCVSEISNEKLQAYIATLSLNHSAKTVKNYKTFLTSVLAAALPDRKYNIQMPKKIPTEYHIPSENALKTLLDNSDGDLHLAILLGAVGGLRRGEICALKQEDVLRDLSAVYVHADMIKDKNKEWIYKPIPKTASSIRKVDLPKQIIDQIPTTDGFIINRSPDWITRNFRRFANKYGLKCRFHDLRHYCASYLHSIGVPDQYIQERGGWRTDQTLKSVYRNTIKEKSVKFAKEANKAFAKSLSDVI